MTSITPATSAPPRTSTRFHFLDGMRAFASLYVLLFHEIMVNIVGHGAPSHALRMLIPHLSRGRIGVVFFIVLSGFSLMLAIARSDSLELPGGFRTYVSRRARRILPPYYAALFLSIALIVVYNASVIRHGASVPIEAALRPGSVISHLLLLHNATFEWVYRINGPMWSVATEWQIYFLLPAVLLPFWRKFGGIPTVVMAWIAGSLPFYLLPPDQNFFWASPWFTGSFALGMAGAVIAESPRMRESALRNTFGWSTVSGAMLVLLIFMCATGLEDSLAYPIQDLLVSILAVSSILALHQSATGPAEKRGVMLKVFSSKTLKFLAGFSYSLYLVQHPALRLAERALGRLPLRYDAIVGVNLLVTTPLVMAGAWLFSIFFEKPFTGAAPVSNILKRSSRTPSVESSS